MSDKWNPAPDASPSPVTTGDSSTGSISAADRYSTNSPPDEIERRHRYRLTKVTTEDYGDGPHAGQFAIGELSIIPDGSFWRNRPQTLNIGVPLGTRPGAEFEVTIAALTPDGGK